MIGTLAKGGIKKGVRPVLRPNYNKNTKAKSVKQAPFARKSAHPDVLKGSESDESFKEKITTILNGLFDFRFNHEPKLFWIFLILLFIGIISVFSATIVVSYNFYEGDKFEIIKRHLFFIGIGSVLMAVFYFVRVELFVKYRYVFLSVTIGLLIYILILSLLGRVETGETAASVQAAAQSANGATRWLRVGGISFQPSDFVKLFFVIFIAAFLSKKSVHYPDFKSYLSQNLIPFVLWLLLILALIAVGNSNLGTAIVIGLTSITTYAVSSVTKYHKIGLAIMLGLMLIGGGTLAYVAQYRMDRVAVFVNYWSTNSPFTPQANCKQNIDCSHHFEEVITALGSGGAGGLGLGQSKGKYTFPLTSAGDDSIIGIIGEENGFILTSMFLLLYLYLIFICVGLAEKFSTKPIYLYLMIGACSWIGYQMFIHVGGNLQVIPLTGQTLPFVSIGGSSLISLMCAMGLILNVSKQRDNIHQDDEVRDQPGKRIVTKKFRPVIH